MEFITEEEALRLVDRYIKREASIYWEGSESAEFGDLCQEGRIGAIRAYRYAMHNGDYKKYHIGQFVKYSHKHIKGQIQHYLRGIDRLIRIPDRKLYQKHVYYFKFSGAAEDDGDWKDELDIIDGVEVDTTDNKKLLYILTGELISILNEEEKELLTHLFYDELTFTETGRLYGITPQAIRKRYAKIARKLKSYGIYRLNVSQKDWIELLA